MTSEINIPALEEKLLSMAGIDEQWDDSALAAVHRQCAATLKAQREQIAQARKQAIEEAARVAEEYRDPSLESERDVSVAAASARASVDIAAAIRQIGER